MTIINPNSSPNDQFWPACAQYTDTCNMSTTFHTSVR